MNESREPENVFFSSSFGRGALKRCIAMRPGSPIIQIRGVEGAGLGGADLPNCYFR